MPLPKVRLQPLWRIAEPTLLTTRPKACGYAWCPRICEYRRPGAGTVCRYQESRPSPPLFAQDNLRVKVWVAGLRPTTGGGPPLFDGFPAPVDRLLTTVTVRVPC